MEFLQNLDNSVVLMGVACSMLCVGGFFILQFLQIFGTLLGFMLQFIEIPLSLFQSCPCGCLVLLLMGCGGFAVIAMVASVLPDCGTAQAVNLCRLIPGY